MLLTDGIYEYEDPSGAQFGVHRVEQVLREHHAAASATLAAHLLQEVRAFARGAPQDDDVTMVLLKRSLAH